jgi:DNA polymerase epsilon subunit 1
MDFALEVENSGINIDDVENYDEIKTKIVGQLEALKVKCPSVESEPLIYHVDVAAMYPNIILSNRL